jgi:cell division septum initiation protein DivIVA
MSPEPPLDATGIARRLFATARKGYDTGEVRAYLHEVSDLVGRLQREGSHEHERAERAEIRATLAEQLDEHRLVELLGEETARVLDAARAAAADIRTKAEDSAARMVREAQTEARVIVERAEKDAAGRKIEILAEADALRREAEDEVERRRSEGTALADELRRDAETQRDRMISEGERSRSEAEAAAEQIRASARDQGRRLVGEAQAVRERILGDLSRRRRVAREQLERLNGARVRLLAAYEVVKRTVGEATNELTVALPEAKAASESAMRRVTEEPEETVEVIEAELSVARMSGLDDDVASAAVTDDELDTMIRELAEEEAAQAAAAAAAEPSAPEAADDRDEPGPPAGQSADPTDAAALASNGGQRPAGDPDAGLPGTGADRGSARPQTDSERWGVRLPRARRLIPTAPPEPARATPGDAAVPAAAPSSPPVGRATPVPPTAAPPAPAAAPTTPAPSQTVSGVSTPATTGVERADDDEGESGPYVDELFARIRAERTAGGETPETTTGTAAEGGAVAVALRADAEPAADAAAAGPAAATAAPADATEDAAEDDTEPADPATRALQGRDDLLAGVERELGRRLKRVLADEQNEVLDLLRRGGTVEFDDIVPPVDEHADRFAIAAMADLDVAATHGAARAATAVGRATARASGDAPSPTSCDELAGELGRDLVEPLRVRIRRSFDDCDGDLEEVTERLRALYREWKGQHIGESVRHYTATAYARGAYASAPDGTELQWLVDPSCEACPDCDDNALAGRLAKGDSFPTGDTCAPAHTDCRCLVVPAAALGPPPEQE